MKKNNTQRKKQPKNTVDLRRREQDGQSFSSGKKSFEEKLENSFINMPAMAYRQKVKMVWVTTFIFSSIIIGAWFYLVAQGVILPVKSNNKDVSLAKLTTEISSGFDKLKDQFSQKKNVIDELKQQLESEALKKQLVNDLRLNLETQAKTTDGVVLIADYPLSDSYVSNPVKITGKAKIIGSQFEVLIKDGDGNLLGQTTGVAEDEKILSSFSVLLNYGNPHTESGVLEFYPIKDKKRGEDVLLKIPVKFIPNLSEWQLYENKEFGFIFQYPLNWISLVLVDNNDLNYLEFSPDDQDVKNNSLPLESDNQGVDNKKHNTIEMHYYNNINQFIKNYQPENSQSYASFEQFLASIGKEKKQEKIGVFSFTLLSADETESKNYYLIQKESGEIFSFSAEESGAIEVLNKILVTFDFTKPDLSDWKEYQNDSETLSLKYPTDLLRSEGVGQIIFNSERPNDFNFYLFTIEPQIEDLKLWVEQSSLNLNQDVVSSENRVFGNIMDGIYYQTKATEQEGEEQDKNISTLGYVFNYNDITYVIKTDKVNFPNTFNTVLGSIRVK